MRPGGNIGIDGDKGKDVAKPVRIQSSWGVVVLDEQAWMYMDKSHYALTMIYCACL